MKTLVGQKAPVFTAPAVVNGKEIVKNFDLEQFIGRKYIILFFYPKDFTFVCPTEIIAFQEKLEEFEKLNTQVIGCSVDSEETHWAWLQTERNKGGIKGVTYPLVSDFSKTISMAYGVLGGEYTYDEEGNVIFEGEPVAYRGLFFIDKNGIIRHIVINDLPIGRSVDEALRIVKAWQYFEQHGEVCPANWKEGAKTFKPTHEDVAHYLSEK